MKELTLNQIADHTYWFTPDNTTDRPTLGVIVGDQGTLLVDAGNSVAHAELLLTAMSGLGLAEPDYALLTHSHWDHVFGATALAAPTFACKETQRIVAEMVTQDWSDAALDARVAAGTEIAFCRDMIKEELPDRRDLVIRPAGISFNQQIEFHLGNISCVAKQVGGDHASDSTIVYVPDDKILFLSDCLYCDIHHGPHKYTSKRLFPLLDEIMSYDADHYIWGHHPEPMPRVEMEKFAKLLRTIGETVDRLGNSRELIVAELSPSMPKSLDEEQNEIIDAFLAGL